MRSEPPAEVELIEVFAAELEAGAPRLQELVLALESDPNSRTSGGEAMRLVHSLKGAARIVGLLGLVETLHAAEDLLTAVERGHSLDTSSVEAALELVDLLAAATGVRPPELAAHFDSAREQLVALAGAFRRDVPQGAADGRTAVDAPGAGAAAVHEGQGLRAVRVKAESLSRLLELAGETVVETRRLGACSRVTTALDRVHRRLIERSLELRADARERGDAALDALAEAVVEDLRKAHQLGDEIRSLTGDGLQRLLDSGERLYLESLRARERPFAQLVPSLRRQVREAATSLSKTVRLEVIGAATFVDGDVLAAMDPMLHHLVTNAVDHGIETANARAAAGKPPQGTVRVELQHSRGSLQLGVTDDGRGIDPERIRARVVERGLAAAASAQALSRDELLEFLFLPGFTTASTLTVHSGRGVGLDAVRVAVTELGGHVRVSSEVGQGTRFDLSLPVTRVVVRALLVRVAGEVYALPLTSAGRVVRAELADLKSSEGRDYVELEGANVGVLRADELLELGTSATPSGALTLVLIDDGASRYGIIVDEALGEEDLVVRPLDPRLGRVPDVAATAILADGSPTLLLDGADLRRSIEKLTRARRPTNARTRSTESTETRRVLVVDDSFTAREAERQLLTRAGYVVDTAADGVEGWTWLRRHRYDLLVADIDMPRMDGIELVQKLRADPGLARLPVVIVSYKDAAESRTRAADAGADHFLTKAALDDGSLVRVVAELVGG